HVVLDLVRPASVRSPQRVEIVDRNRIDALGAEIPQFADRALKYRFDLPVERRGVVRLMEHPEPRAFQSVALQRGGVIRIDVTTASDGRWIVRVLAGNDL